MTERGTVQWFDWRKGYGFIRRDLGGRDAHLHFKDVAGHDVRGQPGRWVAEPSLSLQKDDRVEFEVEDSPKGPRAKNVRVLPPSADTERERGASIVEMIFDLGLK